MPGPMVNAVDEENEPFISVSMIYEEFVACVGAIVANPMKMDENDSNAKPFAIFDLGSGRWILPMEFSARRQ